MCADMNWRGLGSIPKNAVLNFIQDDASTLAAALAFYAILSIAPLLVLTITVLGYLGGETRQQVIDQTKNLMGPEASKGIDLLLANAHARQVDATISTIIGLVVLVLSATTVFGQLQYSLNRIFNVRTRRGAVSAWLHKRFTSILMLTGMGLVILSSIVASSIISFAFQSIGPLLRWVNVVVPIAVFTLVFAIMFRVLPDVKISGGNTWAGGLVSGILFYLGEHGIGWYLAHKGSQSIYGAAGTLIVLLLWLFYSAMIVFLGAELTQAYGFYRGSRIVPNEFAEWDPANRPRGLPSTEPGGHEPESSG
jgi:membrane protein